MSEPETPTPQVPVEPAAAPEPAPEPIDSSANDAAVDREIARKTRRSLLVGGLAALAGGGIWEWLRTRRNEDGVHWPLRLALRTDEELSRIISGKRGWRELSVLVTLRNSVRMAISGSTTMSARTGSSSSRALASR